MGKIGRRGPHKQRKARIAAQRDKIKAEDEAKMRQRLERYRNRYNGFSASQIRQRRREEEQRFIALLGVASFSRML